MNREDRVRPSLLQCPACLSISLPSKTHVNHGRQFAGVNSWAPRPPERRSKMGKVDQRLQELGVTLPTPAAPVANYVGFVRTGNLVVVSGQLCLGPDGKLAEAHKGKLGAGITPEVGQQAARLCAINVLAQLK